MRNRPSTTPLKKTIASLIPPSLETVRENSLAGFTLVEIMVAVSILSLGIVLVVRSFLNVASVLDTNQNRILAMQLLEARMVELELKAREEPGIEPQSKQEEAQVGLREAVYKLEITPLDIEELLVKQEEGKEEEGINEVKLGVSWQEGSINKDVLLVTYLKNKKTKSE